jgi:hypothetical protein
MKFEYHNTTKHFRCKKCGLPNAVQIQDISSLFSLTCSNCGDVNNLIRAKNLHKLGDTGSTLTRVRVSRISFQEKK